MLYNIIIQKYLYQAKTYKNIQWPENKYIYIYLLPQLTMDKAPGDWMMCGVGPAAWLGLVMPFHVKEDNPLSYRSLDTKRASLGL